MRLVVFLFGILHAVIAYAEDSPFLAEIPISLSKQESSFADSQTLQLIYRSYDDEASQSLFKELSEGLSANLDSVGLRLVLEKEATMKSQPLERHTKSSFVIDLEEASTQTFLTGFRARQKDTDETLLDQIAAYASSYIESPTYIHSFLIASKVASDKTGDCTEYAVLTTAIARDLGLPSRYLIGLVILEEEGVIKAFGHAWSEVWHKDTWNIVDGALHELDREKIYYLPTSELENEGPGYLMSVMRAVRYFPKKLDKVTLR